MRLLILASEFPPGPGGIGTHAYQIARQLHHLGWEITVITRQDYANIEELETFNRSLHFAVISLQPMPNVFYELVYRWRTIAAQINFFKPDMILATGQRMVWMSALLRLLKIYPWAAVGHGTEFLIGNDWERRLTRWSFNRANAVICVSRYTENKMLAMGIKPHQPHVIPNGADDKAFMVLPEHRINALRAEKGWVGSKLLLTVGRVSERKGQDTVIRSLPKIVSQIPDVLYLIVGLPEKQPEFAELARSLGVENHVCFLGKVEQPQLTELMNISDVFVMTSRRVQSGDFEGYGIAVIEAALCGKPAVVSQNSGLVEAIAENSTGLSVPEDNPVATADAILSLLTDDARRQTMGIEAQRRAFNEQTWAHRAQFYHQLLTSLVEVKP